MVSAHKKMADGKPGGVPGRSTTWTPEEDEMLRTVRAVYVLKPVQVKCWLRLPVGPS